eukprot:4284022-Amphidinium_carterae.1
MSSDGWVCALYESLDKVYFSESQTSRQTRMWTTHDRKENAAFPNFLENIEKALNKGEFWWVDGEMSKPKKPFNFQRNPKTLHKH